MTVLIVLALAGMLWLALELSDRRYRHHPHADLGADVDRRRIADELRAAEQRGERLRTL
ncbi:hypothetical protein FHX74_002150 [Friedmanniella endophytica]|uniref:Uncharacterized protein n=1 Tax=Microlunatus kandeliicorticis TaxID=1759536 RepID=A0A7W3ISN7_9ACTN|nr:hypothetical protein [Microlunatus kandeliicorticis]MBA8794531.1 hypothetical protein [Microlunatus kandeliicorticis]